MVDRPADADVTSHGLRLTGTLVVVGIFAALWQFHGFRPAVGVWVVWFTQSYLYHVVWSDESDDE